VALYIIVAFSINIGYLTLAPNTVVAPGAAMFLIVVGLSHFGDALRDSVAERRHET
jgi:ABC-type dipeptide/oligopeptide/nickel transport system permease subunit